MDLYGLCHTCHNTCRLEKICASVRYCTCLRALLVFYMVTPCHTVESDLGGITKNTLLIKMDHYFWSELNQNIWRTHHLRTSLQRTQLCNIFFLYFIYREAAIDFKGFLKVGYQTIASISSQATTVQGTDPDLTTNTALWMLNTSY